METKKYGKLWDEYPVLISLDQLYRICRISKRSALYLIQNGIIPATDTGKKTWKYRIFIEDVIDYLRHRDQYGSMIPRGAASSRTKKQKKTGDCNSFAYILYPGQVGEIAEYFEFIYADYADILSADDIADMTGLNRSTITNMLKAGHIKSLMDRPQYLIPKQYLMEFVITQKYLKAKTRSEQFAKVIGGFEIWKSAKSSQ